MRSAAAPTSTHTHTQYKSNVTRRFQFFTPRSHYSRSANDAVRIKVLFGDERGDAKDLQCFPMITDKAQRKQNFAWGSHHEGDGI